MPQLYKTVSTIADTKVPFTFGSWLGGYEWFFDALLDDGDFWDGLSMSPRFDDFGYASFQLRLSCHGISLKGPEDVVASGVLVEVMSYINATILDFKGGYILGSTLRCSLNDVATLRRMCALKLEILDRRVVSLLHHGASPYLKDVVIEDTVFGFAARHGLTRTLMYLLKRRDFGLYHNPNRVAETAIMFLARDGREYMCRYLIDRLEKQDSCLLSLKRPTAYGLTARDVAVSHLKSFFPSTSKKWRRYWTHFVEKTRGVVFQKVILRKMLLGALR